MDVKRWVTFGLALVSSFVVAIGTTEATNFGVIDVRFLDTSESPSVTVDGSAPTLLPDSSGEFFHFTVPYPSGSTFVLSETLTFSLDLVEPGTLVLSDRLVYQVGLRAFDVKFASDPALLDKAGTDLGSIEETGILQSLVGTGIALNDFTDTVSINFSAASDIDPVPEPGTLTLLGSSLAALWAVRRLRRACETR